MQKEPLQHPSPVLPVIRLIALYILSLGLYFYYWYYKNFKNFSIFFKLKTSPIRNTLELFSLSFVIPNAVIIVYLVENFDTTDEKIPTELLLITLAISITGFLVYFWLQLRKISEILKEEGFEANFNPLILTLVFGFLLLCQDLLIPDPPPANSQGHYIFLIQLNTVRLFIALFFSIVQKDLNSFWKYKNFNFKEGRNISFVEIIIFVIGGSFYIWQLFFNPAEDLRIFRNWLGSLPI
jgi:hypothetical protein